MRFQLRRLRRFREEHLFLNTVHTGGEESDLQNEYLQGSVLNVFAVGSSGSWTLTTVDLQEALLTY